MGGELQAIFSCRERKRLGVSQVLQQKLTEYHFHQKYGILYGNARRVCLCCVNHYFDLNSVFVTTTIPPHDH